MSDYTIYALKAGNDTFPASDLFESLKTGEGRFGWSYEPSCDLNLLKAKVASGGNLTDEERDCYSAAFLLDFKAGDWVVYINMPSYGKCAVAKVAGPYQWRYEGDDFNHRFPVDPASVFVFDRNDAVVFPELRSRLRLQGRFWRIYKQEAFEALLIAQAKGITPAPYTAKSNLNFLAEETRPLLVEISERIHRTHPNKDLETPVAELLRNLPGVIDVKCQGGAGDHGADIIMVYESGLPIAGLRQPRTCVVQVKSFTGLHWDTKAVGDIRRAFDRYPEAERGLIVSTASASTESLDKALEELREQTNKPVSLLIGADFAAFFLRYGADLAS